MTMRQMIIPEAGGPDVFEMREAPDPVAGPGEVRVRVRAAGVNFADLSARMGTYQDAPAFPCCIGYEVAGVVDQVGPAVLDGPAPAVAVGDEVFGMTMFGGYADTVVVPAHQVRQVPTGLDLVAAAGVPVVSLTAYTLSLIHI